MPVNLPSFENSLCRHITVCALVETASKPILRALSKRREIVASYNTGGGKAYVRLMVPAKALKRLHIECARAAFFERPPLCTGRKTEVLEFLEPFIGSKVAVRVGGDFCLPHSGLSEHSLVRVLSREEKIDEVALRLTGGSVEIKGGPVTRMRWSMKPEGKEVEVSLEGRDQVTIAEDYLLSSLRWIEDRFGSFVLRRRDRASQQS